MGEWSRRIGEAGENLVGEYFKLIGWADSQKNLSIHCINAEKHRSSDSDRTTHGIDFLFPDRSPLVDEMLNNIVVSVKFSNEPYPDPPTSKFKQHFTDLAQTLECFRRSPQRQDIVNSKMGISRSRDIGVLFWLTNAKVSYDDVISRLTKVNLPDLYPYDAIYLVDNRRVAFIYDALTYAHRVYSGSEIEFYYFETGKNTNPISRKVSGTTLPVEYVNSSVLPLRVVMNDSSRIILMLFVIDGFSEGSLKQMMGLAQKLSGSWASKIMVCFPDYNAINHENIVQKVKGDFDDRKITATIEIRSFATDFLTLQG